MENTFEKMCRELNEIKPCGCSMCDASNEYVCAYKAVTRYVGNDNNRLLKLKAEAQAGDFIAFISTILSILSFLIASLTFILTIIFEITTKGAIERNLVMVLMLIVVTGICVFIHGKIKAYEGVSKWRKYIQVAIEELEKANNPDYQNKK